MTYHPVGQYCPRFWLAEPLFCLRYQVRRYGAGGFVPPDKRLALHCLLFGDGLLCLPRLKAKFV